MCGAEFFCNMLNAMCTHSLIIDIREEISILSIFIPQRTAVFFASSQDALGSSPKTNFRISFSSAEANFYDGRDICLVVLDSTPL